LLKRLRRLIKDIGQFRKAIDAQRLAEARLRSHIDRQFEALAALRAAPPRGPFHRSLVLGLTAGYGQRELAPFVESLRGSGYSGDIALLTFDTDAATSAYLASRRVIEITFDSMPLLQMSMNSARMLKYLEFLRTDVIFRPRNGYDYIMLADVRDIVFQGDPFARVDGADLYYFLETGRTIGTCPVNSVWMMQAFGPDVFRQAASSRVSCAGTLIATPLALMEYLLWMARYIVESPPEVRHSGLDQAIHNYLMIKGLIANARVVENGGAVMTVPTDRASGMEVALDGRLRNADGSVSEVVHQYDRDAVLLAAVSDRYRCVQAAFPETDVHLEETHFVANSVGHG
jgi:hypothetical protein